MKKMGKISVVVLIALMAVGACKKDTIVSNPTGNTPGTIVRGTDPGIAGTQGFFLGDSWQPKMFVVPASQSTTKPMANEGIYVNVDLSKVITKTSPYLFGNNTNPFMGQYVTEPVLMSSISNLSPNILRFPGGSVSDIYFWNAAFNQPPGDAPSQSVDQNGIISAADYWYGNNTYDWTFTVDNYYKVLQQTNSTGLITVNYAYARYGTGPHPDQAAAHLASDWVRYDKGRTKYWEVGNENFNYGEAGYRINTAANQGGQPAILTSALYGTHFKLFADSMHAAAKQVGATIKIGMVLTELNDNATTSRVSNWNAGVLAAAGNAADFFEVHNYYTPYQQNSSPAVILNTPVPLTKSTMDWIKNSVQGADVQQKPIAMDEWNIVSTGSNQMVSQIAGVHAVMVLGELLKNQVSMASRWDMADAWNNGDDMGMFSNFSHPSEEEPGASAWNARPVFYYMYYFQKYFGDRMVSSTVTGSSDILSYASSFTDGQAGDILVNKSANGHTMTIAISNFLPGDKYYYYTLKGGNDAVFSRKVYINDMGSSGVSGGPSNFLTIPANSAALNGGIRITVPAYGVVYLVADKGN
jgi:alpha-L-arabinofuranosidase